MRKEGLDPGREEALRRYRIIVPLLEEGLSECEKRNIRRLIRDQEGISGRTLRRYVSAFKQQPRSVNVCAPAYAWHADSKSPDAGDIPHVTVEELIQTT